MFLKIDSTLYCFIIFHLFRSLQASLLNKTIFKSKSVGGLNTFGQVCFRPERFMKPFLRLWEFRSILGGSVRYISICCQEFHFIQVFILCCLCFMSQSAIISPLSGCQVSCVDATCFSPFAEKLCSKNTLEP